MVANSVGIESIAAVRRERHIAYNPFNAPHLTPCEHQNRAK